MSPNWRAHGLGRHLIHDIIINWEIARVVKLKRD
jgi:hypothetical protein